MRPEGGKSKPIFKPISHLQETGIGSRSIKIFCRYAPKLPALSIRTVASHPWRVAKGSVGLLDRPGVRSLDGSCHSADLTRGHVTERHAAVERLQFTPMPPAVVPWLLPPHP